jgi:prophage antirepressor-like protein
MSNQQVVPFNFNGLAVRTLSQNNIPWFVANDVCEVLAIANSRDAVSRLDDDEKGVAFTDTLGGSQKTTIINESGLYALILRSNKPNAKAFRKWVTSEVLPAIRQTGKYDARAELTLEQKHIALLEKHIQLLENGVSRRTSKASPLFQLDPPQKAVVDAWLQKSFSNGFFRGCGLGMWVDKVQSASLFDSYEFYCTHHNVPKYKWIGIAQLSRYLKTIYPKIKMGYSRDRGFNFGTLRDAIHAFASMNGGVQ